LVLQVYVDDSGGKGQPSPMVFGGLLLDADRWLAFADAWAGALRREPSVRRFKLDEAAGPSGPWRGFDPDVRRAKLHEVAAVLSTFSPRVIRVSVDVDAFRLTLGQVCTKPLNHPYFFALFDTVCLIASHLASEAQTERFEIVFDEHAILSPRVLRWYPQVLDLVDQLARGAGGHWAQLRSILPLSPIFRTDDDLLPLQAADLMAGMLRGDLRGDHKLKWWRPELPPLTWAFDYDREQLQRTMRGADGARVAYAIDPERYAQALGLGDDPSLLPSWLRGRGRAFHASRARSRPASPQSPEPGPGAGPS